MNRPLNSSRRECLCYDRLALERRAEELLAKEAEIPGEVGLAQDEKEAAVAEARRRRALPNSLTRYAGKVGEDLGTASFVKLLDVHLPR